MISMSVAPAFAQSDNLPPRCDSSDKVNRPANWNYATPEDHARPGEKFYFRGVHAFQHKDYTFANERAGARTTSWIAEAEK